MKYRFITILHNMSLEDLKNKGIQILPGGRISNGLDILSQILDTKLMKYTAGAHSIDEFNDTTYFYYDGEFEDMKAKEEMDEIGTKLTFYYLRVIQEFVNCLWLVKDNDIYIRDGFIIAYNKDFEDGYTYKASLSEVFSYSDSFKGHSLFTDKEISNALKYLTVEEFDKEYNYKLPNSDHFYKDKGSNRIIRAKYFIIAARTSVIHPVKITNYCNALECLFSSGYTDISYKISERVSLLLGNNSESKRKIFTLIKKAYDIRSRIVHGNHLKVIDEDLNIISKELDQILRQLVLSDNIIFAEIDNNEINKYFLKLMFADVVELSVTCKDVVKNKSELKQIKIKNNNNILTITKGG